MSDRDLSDVSGAGEPGGVVAGCGPVVVGAADTTAPSV
jgi:hypothetical protein